MRARRAPSRSPASEAGCRAPIGASISGGSATGTSTSTSWPPSSPTRTSFHPSAPRSSRPNPRLSSSSLARITPANDSAGSSVSAVTSGPLRGCGSAGSRTRSLASCAAIRSTRTYRRAGEHRGSAAITALASVPRPAPASTTTNGSGRSSSSHHVSRARANTAPNSGPTSGLVRKSARFPAPRPARIEPVLAVQDFVYVLVERKWALPPDEIDDVGQRASEARSPRRANTCG